MRGGCFIAVLLCAVQALALVAIAEGDRFLRRLRQRSRQSLPIGRRILESSRACSAMCAYREAATIRRGASC